MKDNKKTIIIIIIIVLLLIGFYIKVADFSTPKIDDDKFYKKITELELKIDSLNDQKDSIRTVIDSTHVKIITNEKHYQERINTIITQPADSDYEFITAYARQHRAKRISNNMSGTREIEY
jgi:hypothetical protein